MKQPGKKLWNQSIARKSLIGGETMNPSLAARSLLIRDVVTRASRKLRTYRPRRFFKGNPVPALVGVLGSGLLGGLGKRFRAPSDKRAAGLAPQLVIAANSGNLTAARGLIERAALPMNMKEHQVWLAAAGQLAPKVRAAVTKYAELIPAADQGGPEQFAASVQAQPVSLTQIEAQQAEELAAAKRERGAAAAGRAAVTARREANLTAIGTAGLTALARGGRRPLSRRRRRPRDFNF